MPGKDTFVFVVHADAWSVNFVFVLPFKPPTLYPHTS